MRWYYLSEKQEQLPLSEDQFPGMAAMGLLRPQTMVWKEGMGDWVSLGEIRPELFQQDMATGSEELAQGSAQAQGIESPRTVGRRLHKPTKHSHRLSAMTPGSARDIATSIARHHGWILATAIVLIIAGALGFILGLIAAPGAFRTLNEGDNFVRDAVETAQGEAPPTWMPAFLTTCQVILSAWLLWGGVLLFRGAAMVRNAEALGDTNELTAGLDNIGRWFRMAAMFIAIVIVLAFVLANSVGTAAVMNSLK